MLAPILTVAPAVPVVDRDEAKEWLRVSHSDDDTMIEGLVFAAISHLDGYSGILGRALVNQTWRQDFDAFSTCDPMRLPLVPVQSVASVTYYDADNASQTLADTYWQVFADEGGAYLGLKPDQSWPATYGRADAVSVTFVAGYGAAATDVPEALRLAIKFHVQMHYEPDGDRLRPAFNALIGPFHRFSL